MNDNGYPIRYYCSKYNTWYLVENTTLPRGKEYVCPGCCYIARPGIQMGPWYLYHINDMGNGHKLALATEYTRWAPNPLPTMYKAYSHKDWTIYTNVLKSGDRMFLPKGTLVRPLFRMGVGMVPGTANVSNIAGIQEAFIPARLTRDILVKHMVANISPIDGRWGNAAGHGRMPDSYDEPNTVDATANMHDSYNMQVWWYAPIYSIEDRVTYYGMTVCKLDE